MKRETLLTIAVIALFVLNIGTLGYLVFSQRTHGPFPPPHSHHNRFDEFLIRELSLTDEQIQKFEQLKEEHHTGMVDLDKRYETVLHPYFDLLKTQPVDTMAKDSLERELAFIQQQRAAFTLQHFSDLRAILNEQQQQKFNTIIPELMQVIKGPRGKRPPHHHP